MGSITDTSICNSALMKIGAERIISLSDDNKRARICSEQYPKLRDMVLMAHPWTFARKRAILGRLTDAPAWGFAYQFQLPSDCLRVTDTENTPEYFIEGGLLLTDDGTVKVRYISQITDPTLFTPLFAESLATRLAAEISYPIVQSRELGEAMMKAYFILLKEARTVEAQQGTPDQLQVNEFLDSRF